MEIRPLDLTEMATLNYDITTYQPILFAAESVDHLEDVVGTLLRQLRRRRAGADQGRPGDLIERPDRLRGAAATRGVARTSAVA